jgi:ankyrin repeat protein
MLAAGLGWNDNTMRTAVANGFGAEDDTLEALKLLVDLGLDVNAADAQGRTAMHGAASRGVNEVVKFLAAHGARIDVRSNDTRGRFNASDGVRIAAAKGRTPLDEAMLSDPQRPKTVALLRQMLGLDPNAPLPKFAPDSGQ